MTELQFVVLDAQPAAQLASPGIVFRLRISRSGGGRVHALLLRMQVQLDARRRRYRADEQVRLYELFGEPSMWDRTVRTIEWAHVSIAVPSFDGAIDIDVPVACTYDLDVASAVYLHALRDGDVPLTCLFRGTVFTGSRGALAVEPIQCDGEAVFRMPVRLWREAMDRFFPGGGWIRLRQDTIDRLQALRGQLACVTWDDTIDTLLQGAQAPATGTAPDGVTRESR